MWLLLCLRCSWHLCGYDLLANTSWLISYFFIGSVAPVRWPALVTGTSYSCFQILLFFLESLAVFTFSGVLSRETSETQIIVRLVKHTHSGRKLVNPIPPDTILRRLEINAASGWFGRVPVDRLSSCVTRYGLGFYCPWVTGSIRGCSMYALTLFNYSVGWWLLDFSRLRDAFEREIRQEGASCLFQLSPQPRKGLVYIVPHFTVDISYL